MKHSPFFLVVDDGGRPYIQESGSQTPILMGNYLLLLELAEQFQLTMPVAYCFRYLDKDNVCGLGGALPYSEELAGFICESKHRLPLYHHGLTHGYDYVQDDWCWTATHAEFYDLDHARPVPEEQQARHLDLCREIYQHLDLGTPEAFVPPCHAWEAGVTDRLLSERGIGTILSVPRLRFNGKEYRRDHSEHVSVLPRRSLGIITSMTAKLLTPEVMRRALRLIVPTHPLWRLRYYRKLKDPALHSYYLHITNFFPGSRDFWCRFFEAVRRRPDLCFPATSAEALQAFLDTCKGERVHA